MRITPTDVRVSSPARKCTVAAGRDGNETCTCGHLFMAHRFRNGSTIVCCELCDMVEADKVPPAPPSGIRKVFW